MRVWIIAHFVLFPGEPGINRFHYLAELLSKLGHDVTLITSRFSHKLKRYRDIGDINVKYNVILIDEPKYDKNLSFQRIKAHIKFGKNLSIFLKRYKTKPDVILVAYPSISCAYAVRNFAVKNEIPYVVDVQDWWPEAFEIAFNNRFIRQLYRYSIKPFKIFLRRIFSDASAIIAVSESYLKNAVNMSSRKAAQLKEIVPLGIDIENFDEISSKYIKNRKDNLFKLIYIGQVGPSYDLETVIKATSILRKEIPELKVYIVGDGTLRKKLEKLAEESNCRDKIEFTGFLQYEKMIEYLINSDVALNAIKQEWIFLPNKVFDYCAARLPIINSIKKDFGYYVEEYNMGINYSAGNIDEFSDAVRTLHDSKELREMFGNNARKFVENMGNRRKNYYRMVDILEKVSGNFK